jgi:hypothetical protein
MNKTAVRFYIDSAKCKNKNPKTKRTTAAQSRSRYRATQTGDR